MGKFINLTGQRFGRLTAVKRVGTKNGSPLWECICDCGRIIQVSTNHLRSGNTRSCGCIHKEQLVSRNIKNAKHGYEGERLYGVWRAMKQRCSNSNRKDFSNYGGRGVVVCTEWLNDYVAFRKWAFSNGYDPNASYMACTLDRIDVNKGYCPSNCRWVDMKIQANNRRRRKTYGDN